MPTVHGSIALADPTVNDVHVDAVLSNFSVSYRNESYIADGVVPPVLVRKASDKYFVFNQGDLLRQDVAAPRAPATEGPVRGYRISTDNYTVTQYSMAVDVADEERDNADDALDLDQQAAELAADSVRMRIEIDVANLLTTSSNYATGHSTDLSGGTQWSDPTADPIADIRSGMHTVASKTGRKPTALWMGEDVWVALADHPNLRNRLSATERGVVLPELLAQLLGLEAVYIGEAVVNTAAEGETDSFSRIWGKHAGVILAPRNPGLRTVAFAYRFTWRSVNFVTERYRLPGGARADRFRVRTSYDLKVVDNRAAYLWQNAVA